MSYEAERKEIERDYQDRKADLDRQFQQDLAMLDLRYNGLTYTDRIADASTTIEVLGITSREATRLVRDWWKTGRPS